MAEVKAKNPGEVEFHQAVQEVVENGKNGVVSKHLTFEKE
jgi:hypothetical protein